MVLAVAHAVFGLLVGQFSYLFEDSQNDHLAMLCVFGALVPDFDFLLVLLFSDMGLHRSFANQFWVPFALFGILGLVFYSHWKLVLFFCMGYLSHIILDYLFVNLELLHAAMIDGILVVLIVLFMIWRIRYARTSRS